MGCKGCNVYKRARKKKRKMNLGAFITRNFRASLLPDRIPTVINIGTFIYHYAVSVRTWLLMAARDSINFRGSTIEI